MMKNKFLLKACASNAERKIWDHLIKLPEEYHVFAGVLGIQTEIDFLITHPHKGILLIEVKGGFVSNKKINGRDHMTSQGLKGIADIKNPFLQVSSQHYDFLNRLREQGLFNKFWIPSSFAVCLPDNEHFEGDYPDSYEANRLVLRGHLSYLQDKIDQLFELSKKSAHKSFGREGQDAIRNFLIPKEILFSEIIEQNAKMYTYDPEKSVLSIFHRDDHFNNHIMIEGAAGTGKTTIAIEAAQRLHLAKKHTLVLCYNDPLKWHLQAKLKNLESIDVYNFHDFCIEMAKKSNHSRKNEFDQKRGDPNSREFWQKDANDILLESLCHLGDQIEKFDALIVDEAQDFCFDWYSTIKLVLKEDAKEYIFQDVNQKIYDRSFSDSQKDQFIIHLNTNHRLPADILDMSEKYVTNLLQDTNYTNLMRQRLIIKNIQNKEELAPRLEKIINELITKEKVRAQDIAVLTPRVPNKIESFKRFLSGNNKTFKAEFRISEKQRSGVLFETIHRFKGLESPIVIMTELSAFPKDKFQNLLYTGLTRAHIALIILGTDEEMASLGLIEAQNITKKAA
jgi:hypothetical protein